MRKIGETGGRPDSIDLFGALRRRRAWFLGPLLAVPGLALLWAAQQPAVYSAEARVSIGEGRATTSLDAEIVDPDVRVTRLANGAELAMSDRVVDRVGVDRLTDSSGNDDLESLAVTTDAVADVLVFTVRHRSADEAATVADDWADAFIEARQRQFLDEIDAAIATFEADLDEANEETGRVALARIDGNAAALARLTIERTLVAETPATVTQAASIPVDADGRSVTAILAVAVGIGALLGVAAALSAERRDRTVSTLADIERLGLPVLGSIPIADKSLRRRELATVSATHPDTPVAEAYQKVRTALQFALLEHSRVTKRSVRSVVVTSPNPGDGKTTTAVNLAMVCASVDQQAILVDTDLRRPRVHHIFNTAVSPGITDALVEDLSLNQIAVRSAESPESVAALPAGTTPPSPSTFLASPMFGSFVDELNEAADVVIYDAPPVLAVSDALSVAQHADGVILVASANNTGSADLIAAADAINRAGAHILGVVLTRAKSQGRQGNYYGPVTAPPAVESTAVPSVIDLRDQPVRAT